MATTKKILSEQIQRIYARFLEKDNPSDVIDLREILLLVNQAINSVLKIQVADNFKAGIIDVPLCNIVEYTASTVADATNGLAYAELPVIPLALPNGLGIWSVSKSNGVSAPYIPIPAQDYLVFGVANADNPMSFLENQVGYFHKGKRIIFTKNINAAPYSVSSVIISVLCSDLSLLGDNDLLPISPEVESSVITEVLRIIGGGQIAQAELESQKAQKQ